MIDCIDRMIPLQCDQLEIHQRVTTFSKATSTFGNNLAKIAREANELAQWWEAFGSHCPQLQKFAIRILSQTCSATGCERNWSVFERIHMKKRNRLDQKQLNDLVYFQYNLWLKHNQLLNKRPNSDPIVLEDIDPMSDWVVESHPTEFDSDEDLDLDLQLASATTTIVAVGDDVEEESWVSPSDSDSEVELDDVGSSSSSQ
eukprot:PITA_07824